MTDCDCDECTCNKITNEDRKLIMDDIKKKIEDKFGLDVHIVGLDSTKGLSAKERGMLEKSMKRHDKTLKKLAEK